MDINAGDIWIHHSGKEYEVIGVANIANNNPKYEPYVVFKSVVNGNLWTQSIENFLEKMKKKEKK